MARRLLPARSRATLRRRRRRTRTPDCPSGVSHKTAIVMRLSGGKEVTLPPAQTFHERRDDGHVVGRNASATEPAKFLVVLIKDKGAPVLVPAE